MSKIEKIAENKNYSAVDIGALDQLMEHSLIHPISKQEVKGKVFLKDATQSSGTEISFQVLPPKAELSYFHKHKQNEETYIIIKGEGDFQVDDDCFTVREGSIIRIKPDGIRGLRNSSDRPMLYMVIQSKEDSLEQYSTVDGERIEHEAKWK